MEKEILLKVEVDRSQSQKELEGVTRDLLTNKDALTQLNKAYKEGSVSTDQFVRQSLSLKKNQKDLTEQQRHLTKELSVEANSLDALRLKLSSLTKERNATNQSTKEGALRASELTQEIKNTSDAIKEQEQAGGDFRRNVGNYGEAFQEAVGGVQVFGASLGSLFKMILANPVGLIITALVGLFNILKQNDTIATAFSGVMTGLGVVMDNISAVISQVALGVSDFFGESSKTATFIQDVFIRVLNNLLAPLQFMLDIMPALGAALDGEFSKAAGIAATASINFGKSIAFANGETPKLVSGLKEAVKAGIEYEAALDAIESKQSALNVTIAELINKRDELIIQSKDISKSEEERIKLNERSEAINKRILSERVALLNEEIKAQQRYVAALGEDSVKREEAEFKLNDLIVKRLEFQNEALRFEELAQNKRNALLEKQQAQRDKEAEEEQKRKKKQQEDEEKFIDRSIASQTKLQEFRLSQAAKNAEDIDARLKKELELEDFKIAMALENENLLASERLFIVEQSEAKKLEIIKASEDKQRQEAEKTAKIKQQVLQHNLGMAEGVANSLAALAEDGSEAQKMLATTAAFINTAQGVTGALANSAPPPIGLGPVGSIVMAATIGASGLAQIAKINAAAGGGDFVTTKPTLLLVGDNPGGRERVTVEPLSGKGKTKLFKDSGMIAMAGGGSITTGATLSKGLSGPISNDIGNTSSLITALENMPVPEVKVKEIVKGIERVRVKQKIKSL